MLGNESVVPWVASLAAYAGCAAAFFGSQGRVRGPVTTLPPTLRWMARGLSVGLLCVSASLWIRFFSADQGIALAVATGMLSGLVVTLIGSGFPRILLGSAILAFVLGTGLGALGLA